MTLKDIIKEHPEWADLDVVIYHSDKSLHYVDEDGSGYLYKSVDIGEDGDEEKDVLVFSFD